ncbi:MAG: LD-carboxypeptidase [Desulfococcaceae bacterium]|jgi:muramoyltetrapeptide carboxypeptidase|nr:LD-carboxypeptidase [Desulfococcaceae bacterium]
MLMNIPELLQKGDTIGIAAPAGSADRETLHKGSRILEAQGFSVFLPQGLMQNSGYLAGEDAHRAEILHRLFTDDSVRAILCARGGYGSLRLLPLLDYDLIRRHPKIFMGFSDITALLSVFCEKCHMICFHGPMLSTLKAEDSLADFFQSLASGGLLRIPAANPLVLRSGRAGGRLAGGNLATLCHMVGTDFHPFFEGKILLLEDWKEPLYKIDRMLSQMKLAACFRGVRGIVLGSFSDCAAEKEIHSLLQDIFREDDIPIMAGFDIGHGPCNTPLPLGCAAEMDTEKAELCIFGPFTRQKSSV